MDILSQSTIIDEMVRLLLDMRKYRAVVYLSLTNTHICVVAIPIVRLSYQSTVMEQPSNKDNDVSEWYNKEGRDQHILDRKWDLPAFTTKSFNSRYWYKNGKKHRDNNNPAIIMTSNKGGGYNCMYWYINDKLHRHDNPAVITCINGVNRIEWWIEGKQIFSGLS